MAEDTTLPTPAPAMLPPALSRLAETVRKSPLASPAVLPWVGVAVIGLLLVGWLLLRAPERAPLYNQLPDADKAAVVSALETAGLSVALDSRTGAVMLPPADHARARMLLAAAGLPKAAPGGADLLSGMPLGTSRALEGARLKTAQERELARSIESLDGVLAALVLIAQPEASPFVRDRAPVTASVSLTLAPGRILSEGQSRAIVHLVAGAVPGLSPDHVTIADQTGKLLAGDPSTGQGSQIEERLRMQTQMEARARDAVLALLTPIVGHDGVSAQVSIDLDFSQRDASREQYDRDGALRSEATASTTDTAVPKAMGIPGALTNTVPSAPEVTAEVPVETQSLASSNSTTRQESATRNYELGRSIEVTSRHGGQVRRLTAAVAIRADSLGPAAGRAKMLEEIQALVEGAVGYDPERGDRIAVSARNFAPPVETVTPIWQEPVVVESSKWLATALVAIAILLLVVRPLLKRAMTGFGAQKTSAPVIDDAGETAAPMLVDYAAKLAEARLLAATDTARATAVARRLLADPAPEANLPATTDETAIPAPAGASA